MKYERVHKVLGEGDFVLVVSEGSFGDHAVLDLVTDWPLRADELRDLGLPQR